MIKIKGNEIIKVDNVIIIKSFESYCFKNKCLGGSRGLDSFIYIKVIFFVIFLFNYVNF